MSVAAVPSERYLLTDGTVRLTWRERLRLFTDGRIRTWGRPGVATDRQRVVIAMARDWSGVSQRADH